MTAALFENHTFFDGSLLGICLALLAGYLLKGSKLDMSFAFISMSIYKGVSVVSLLELERKLLVLEVNVGTREGIRFHRTMEVAMVDQCECIKQGILITTKYPRWLSPCPCEHTFC